MHFGLAHSFSIPGNSCPESGIGHASAQHRHAVVAKSDRCHNPRRVSSALSWPQPTHSDGRAQAHVRRQMPPHFRRDTGTWNRGVSDPGTRAGPGHAHSAGVAHASVPLHLNRNRGHGRQHTPPNLSGGAAANHCCVCGSSRSALRGLRAPERLWVVIAESDEGG
jgi:hypothetical protein